MSARLPNRIYQAASVGTATDYRPLHLTAYSKVAIWVTVEGVTGGPTSGTVDVKVQYTDPVNGDGVTANWIDVPGKAINQVAYNASNFGDPQIILLDPTDILSMQMRLVITTTIGGGTSPKFVISINTQGWM
jgi:hypothetical protein